MYIRDIYSNCCLVNAKALTNPGSLQNLCAKRDQTLDTYIMSASEKISPVTTFTRR